MTTVPVPETRLTALFRTPRGSSAQMAYRDGTNDYNTLNACMTEDEYGLAAMSFGPGSVLVDVGAYAGGVSIGLALDNPDAWVIAVEPLPPNVEIIADNLERNGLDARRVTLIPEAVAAPGVRSVTVRWGFDETESGRHHRYVGNSSLCPQGAAQEAVVSGISLTGIVDLACGGRPRKRHVSLLKVDCEGGEYDLFADADALQWVDEIRGEYHDGWDRLVALLDATHVVTQTGSCTDHFGSFRATPR